MRRSLFPALAGPALLLAAGYAVTVVVPAVADVNTTRTDQTRQHTVGDVRGQELYSNNGCVYCHSLARRDTFTDAGLGEGPSGASERLNDEPAGIGQARYGPDLSCVGDRVPGAADDAEKEARVEAMIRYLEDPSAVHPGSTMPSYRILRHADLRRLATYLVELSCEVTE